MIEVRDRDEEKLVVGLFDRGIIKFGDFTLKSNRKSPVYYNQRPLPSVDPKSKMTQTKQREIKDLAVNSYVKQVRELDWDAFDHIYGIPQAATPIAAIVADKLHSSYLSGRVGKKDYGQHEAIEGDFAPGQEVLLLDDVITNADSKLEAAATLEGVGLKPVGFVVMFDREEGGASVLEDRGHRLLSVTGLSSAVAILQENKRIGTEEIENLQAYHEGLIAEGVASTFNLRS